MKTPDDYAAMFGDSNYHTHDELRKVIAEAIADARRATLEEAAKVLDERAAHLLESRFSTSRNAAEETRYNAETIRALLDSATVKECYCDAVPQYQKACPVHGEDAI